MPLLMVFRAFCWEYKQAITIEQQLFLTFWKTLLIFLGALAVYEEIMEQKTYWLLVLWSKYEVQIVGPTYGESKFNVTMS